MPHLRHDRSDPKRLRCMRVPGKTKRKAIHELRKVSQEKLRYSSKSLSFCMSHMRHITLATLPLKTDPPLHSLLLRVTSPSPPNFIHTFSFSQFFYFHHSFIVINPFLIFVFLWREIDNISFLDFACFAHATARYQKNGHRYHTWQGYIYIAPRTPFDLR